MAATALKRNSLLETLTTRFAAFRDGLPLALGIHKAIKEQMPEVDLGQLRLALKAHTASFRYLKAIATGKQRFDLDGNPAGELTDEHREIAANELRQRFKKAAERRKVEEKARKDQEARQQHAEKLAQLAARFNSR